MKPVLADTSYYLALVSSDDRWHGQAIDLSETLLGRIFVTEYVLVELGSALCHGPDRQVYLDTLVDIKSDEQAVVIPASLELFERGLELFASRPDKNWSLVDCISFIVMKQKRLTDALTTDRHFQQAGFKALLT